MLPFWLSIAVLSLVQAAVLALPSGWSPTLPGGLHGRLWAAVPPASVLLFVLAGSLAGSSTADLLTYLALLAVPALAAFALGWLIWRPRRLLCSLRRPAWIPGPPARPRPWTALLAVPLFALAWADRGALAGDASAVALSALSCVTLGVLLSAVAPARLLALGIVLMALADTALVVSELLQHPNDVLNAARPAADLPRLQSVAFGSAVMGYGDLFVAGLLGGLLAVAGDRSRQLRGAALLAGLALGFDLLFFVVHELPATVPVAVATILMGVGRRRGRHGGGAVRSRVAENVYDKAMSSDGPTSSDEVVTR